MHARGDGEGRAIAEADSDRRRRQRPLRHPPHRADARALRRALHRRCFTEIERRSRKGGRRAASYAKRFAAKEACAKALGTGLRRGVFWRDMGVVNLPSGQPTMRLTGGAASASRRSCRRDRGLHPPDDHRRAAARPGLRHHRGAPGAVIRRSEQRTVAAGRLPGAGELATLLKAEEVGRRGVS